MEDEVKEVKRNKLSPEGTILLTIGASALAIVLYRVIYFIFTGA